MKYLLILLVVFLTACQQENAAESSSENPAAQAEAAALAPDSTNAVAVSIEGKALSLANIDWAGSKAKITADAISLALSEKGNPLKLNLEVLEAGILAKGTATYVLPLAKKDEASVDLSFIDSTRPGIAMKQRVLFTEGSIEIKAVTANSLQMVFKGTGHALMDQKKFPIEGSVNVTF
jgi:PBP1b-binding outer membrane lipoprotein LpoB